MGDEVRGRIDINWVSLIAETEAIRQMEEARERRDREQTVGILYRYSWGQTGPRRIIPQRIRFGTSECCPEPQWLMDAIDTEIDQEVPFAIKDIIAWEAPI